MERERYTVRDLMKCVEDGTISSLGTICVTETTAETEESVGIWLDPKFMFVENVFSENPIPEVSIYAAVRNVLLSDDPGFPIEPEDVPKWETVFRIVSSLSLMAMGVDSEEELCILSKESLFNECVERICHSMPASEEFEDFVLNFCRNSIHSVARSKPKSHEIYNDETINKIVHNKPKTIREEALEVIAEWTHKGETATLTFGNRAFIVCDGGVLTDRIMDINDVILMEAVGNLINANGSPPVTLTPTQIIMEAYHIPRNSVTKNDKKDLHRRMIKLMTTVCAISGEEKSLYSTLINAVYTSGRSQNGSITDAFTFYDIPLWYKYCKKSRHLVNLKEQEWELIGSGYEATRTNGSVSLNRYLLQRLKAFEYKKSQQTLVILLESAVSGAGLPLPKDAYPGTDPSSRSSRSRLKKQYIRRVKLFLDRAKAIGLINEYEFSDDRFTVFPTNEDAAVRKEARRRANVKIAEKQILNKTKKAGK